MIKFNYLKTCPVANFSLQKSYGTGVANTEIRSCFGSDCKYKNSLVY